MPTFPNLHTPGRFLRKSKRADAAAPVEPVADEPLLSNEEMQEIEGQPEKDPRHDDQ